MNTLDSHDSIEEMAASLMPGWSPDEWLQWPPDLFALTSLILRATGAYRFAVNRSEAEVPWITDLEWSTRVEKSAREWLEGIETASRKEPESHASEGGGGKGGDNERGLFQKHVETLKKYWPKPILTELGEIESLGEEPHLRDVAIALVALHVISDQACANMGIPVGRPSCAETHLAANILLAKTGSLSRISRHCGLVVPKMRTPQTGLSIRSFSHHVTFHSSEVEVRWRSMPWMNIEENTLNFLLVPWPEELRSKFFRPFREAMTAQQHFVFDPDPIPQLKDRFASLYHAARAKAKRIHVVVFPELALTRTQLEEIREVIVKETPDQVPMILTGIRQEKKDDQKREVDPENSVVLSVFFADKWYLLEQEKHHRWRLDRDQIRRYGLASTLPPVRVWWEATRIPKRRLHFLVPNGWLALCPLICEDLAQLEPISELIRGVGPTLVLAILMDGPQLPDRWPARYASVLAGDPGCSVLTLTSLGMCTRSIPEGKSVDRTIALWRDELEGWHKIELNEDKEAVVLTLAAEWKEEQTADTRGDNAGAALVKFQGVHQISAADPVEPKSTIEREATTGKEVDIFELSAATYLVDAVLARPDGVTDLTRWILAEETKSPSSAANGLFKTIWECLLKARKHERDMLDKKHKKPLNVQAEEVHHDTRERTLWPKPDLRYATEVVRGIAKKVTERMPDLDRRMDQKAMQGLWECVADIVSENLKNPTITTFEDLGEKEMRRVHKAMNLAFLWSIHARLSRYRRSGSLNHSRMELLLRVEDIWEGSMNGRNEH